ncbi:MAG: acyl carrier protein [bacterium]
MDEIENRIKNFIFENFLIGQKNRELQNDISFLDEGIIDSTGMLELVAFIEDTYGLVVEDEELIPDNLDSVNRIIAYLERKGCLASKK